MYFFLLNFPLIFTLLIQLCQSYIYPIVCEKCSNKDDSSFGKHAHEGEGELIRDMVNNIILPIKNGLCNLWVNFLEVYDCVASQYGSSDSSGSSKEAGIRYILGWLPGMGSQEEHIPKCSYYSITIVASSLLLILALLYSTKKMVDYFREEDYLDLKCPISKQGSFNRKFNMCNCKLNEAPCDSYTDMNCY